MDPSSRLTELDPRPIWTPVASEHGVRRSRSPLLPADGDHEGGLPPEGIALRLGPENRIPDHPGSAVGYSGPLDSRPLPFQQQQQQPQQQQQMFAPPPSGPHMQQYETPDIRTLRQSCQYNLREYLALQRKRQRFDASMSNVDLESRLHSQAGMVLSDLMNLRSEVRNLAKAAQNHRWRKWLVGGIFASFIPLVRRIFRRRNHDENDSKLTATNDTEYAFQRAKSILSRIKDSVLGRSGFASIAFFVFGVMYIFQNEVSIRVARTIQKRIKKLADRIQDGDDTVEERDLKALEGWRWRVLLCPGKNSFLHALRGEYYSLYLVGRLQRKRKPEPYHHHLAFSNQFAKLAKPGNSSYLAQNTYLSKMESNSKTSQSSLIPDVPGPAAEETQEQKDRRFRLLYTNPPDFKRIAALDPDFAAIVNGRELDFKNPEAVMQLSKTLLKQDFGLTLELPSNRLCPPIPNRHNYILWLKDLVDSTTYNPPGGKLIGIDIGTGASYIDEESLEWAKKNIHRNSLENRIQVVRATPNGPIIPIAAAPSADDVAFVMTNPPFYKSDAEMAECAVEKLLPPLTACTGAPVEKVKGGY
ncbi:hypothetical protein NQ176_g5865 [Zarea fungicola]|uniref:Uncharacterized protein n=1 Tax=Zarea fungicola TaxID=93591 RepID=A0ACC1N680_9HYPO|nr:hypothetical protein NQ176_g5865 [Lecanicillium fungicola]